MVLFALLQLTAAVLPPVPLAEAGVVRRPSLAIRALSMEGVPPPTVPVTHRLQCSVAASGAMGFCTSAAAGVTTDPAEFDRRFVAGVRTGVPTLRAALLRARYYRVAPMSSGGAGRSVLIDETVSAADAPRLGPAKGMLPPGTLRITGAAGDLAANYPAVAMRAGVGARMAATCRVLADHSLFCRNAGPVPGSPPIGGEIGRAFARATVRVLAGMTVQPVVDGGDSAGHDIRPVISWTLPE